MAVNLTQSDFLRLSQILQTYLRVLDIRGRVNFIEGMLLGSPPDSVRALLGMIDFSGAVEFAASEIILRLRDYGLVTVGQEALGILINSLEMRSGEGDRHFLRSLFARYPLQGQTAAGPDLPLENWQDRHSTIEMVEEKIIGDNTFQEVRVLRFGYEAAKSVAQIIVPGLLYGTGFLVAPNLLMTNNHVLQSREVAREAIVRFNFELDQNNRLASVSETTCVKNGIFYTSQANDCTVVEIEPVNGFDVPLKLKAALVNVDDRITIIQHPGGREKKISMRENCVAYSDARVIQYYTATESGSSGAPCFDDEFLVVALHHAGGMLEQPGTKRRYFRNEGIAMAAILLDLRTNAPDLFARINSLNI